MKRNTRLTIVLASVISAAAAILIIFLLILGGKSIAANYDGEETGSNISVLEEVPTQKLPE